MQGAGDSLSYVVVDSTITLFKNPIVWTGDDQMTGDTIRVFLSENKPKSAYLWDHAFIISKGYYEGHFNQIKGLEIVGYFNDSSELETIRAFENVKTIYYVTDDVDNSLIGILVLDSEEMELKIENQEIVTINYLRPVEEGGSMFPDTELPLEDRFLEGFLWQIDRRPKSKFDIIPEKNKGYVE
jgi:hypothetical protein